jgi:hypothetical protein
MANRPDWAMPPTIERRTIVLGAPSGCDDVNARPAGSSQKGNIMLAAWQVGEVFWSFLWFSLFFIWIWLLISVFADIFRSDDLGGWGKALWSLFVIVLPYLGVFVYLIARGHSMGERTAKQMQAQEAATQAYIRDAAGSSSSVDEIAKAAALRDSGTITEEEFSAIKAKALA